MHGEVVEPEESGTLALEDVGNPAEGVVEVPEGDTDASGRLSAATDSLCILLAMDPEWWPDVGCIVLTAR